MYLTTVTIATTLAISLRLKNERRQVNEPSCGLRMATCRGGVKRKGDKIRIGL